MAAQVVPSVDLHEQLLREMSATEKQLADLKANRSPREDVSEPLSSPRTKAPQVDLSPRVDSVASLESSSSRPYVALSRDMQIAVKHFVRDEVNREFTAIRNMFDVLENALIEKFHEITADNSYASKVNDDCGAEIFKPRNGEVCKPIAKDHSLRNGFSPSDPAKLHDHTAKADELLGKLKMVNGAHEGGSGAVEDHTRRADQLLSKLSVPSVAHREDNVAVEDGHDVAQVGWPLCMPSRGDALCMPSGVVSPNPKTPRMTGPFEKRPGGICGDVGPVVDCEETQQQPQRPVARHRQFEKEQPKTLTFYPVDCTGDKTLGLHINPRMDVPALEITAIKDGAALFWNRANPTMTINVGDRIVGVDAEKGSVERLLHALGQSRLLSITCERN